MADLETWDVKNVAELAHQALAKLEELQAEMQALRDQVEACHGDRRMLLERWREATRDNETLAVKIGSIEGKAGKA